MAKGIWISEREFLSFSDPKKGSLFQEIATRSGAIDFFSLGMYLPDPDPVLKKMGKDQKVYKELATDPRVGSNVASRKAGVLSMEWGIDRGKAKSRPAKAIEEIFKRLDVNRILSAILDAPYFGYQPLEVLWENQGGLIVPRDVVAKPREWFCFSAENELLLRTRANPNGVPVPEKKFLCPVYNGSYENPYGERTLSRVFWPVTFKKGGLKFWVGFVEKFGTPWVIGKMPRGTDKAKIDDLADTLEAMITDAVAVIPDDSSVEIIEAAGKSASSDLHRALVEWCNSEVSTAILGHAGASQSTPGKLGGEEAAIDVKQELIDADRNLAVGTIDTLIGWIHELNFGAGERPAFSLWQEEDVDLDLATRDKTLSETGVRFSKKYFTKTYGFEEEDIEEISKGPSALPPAQPPAPGEPPSFADRGGCPHCSGSRKSPAINIHMSDEITDPEVLAREVARQVRRAITEQGFEFADPQGDSAPPFPDQAAIDDALEAIPAEELARQMEGLLKPVIDLISSGKSHEEVLSALAEAYPNMKDEAIEEMLSRAIFVSELWGRLNAAKG